MGSMFGWECAGCGASERFSCGYGMMSLRDADVVRRAREGEYGRAMATLFRDGVPDGWHLIRSRVYYRCHACDVTLEGARLLVDDGSDGELACLVAPGACPSCGMEPDLEDLMSEAEIIERCLSRESDGCPVCGAHTVSSTCGRRDWRQNHGRLWPQSFTCRQRLHVQCSCYYVVRRLWGASATRWALPCAIVTRRLRRACVIGPVPRHLRRCIPWLHGRLWIV